MIILFVIMLVGCIAYKKKIMEAHAVKTISAIVINIANPALILSSSAGEIEGQKLLATAVLAFGIYAVLMIAAQILPPLLHVPKSDYGTYRLMTVFSNIGFMGFPLICAMYGNEALLYGAVFLMPYNLLIYTYGIMVIKAKDGEGIGIRSSLRELINPGVIACLITFILVLTKLPVPQMASSVFDMLGSMTAPLSMLVIGATFATMDFKSILTDKKLLLFVAIHLLVIPILGILIIKLFVTNTVILGISLVVIGTPIGSMPVMLAQQYGGDQELASRGVAISTILSVITLPAVSLLCL